MAKITWFALLVLLALSGCGQGKGPNSNTAAGGLKTQEDCDSEKKECDDNCGNDDDRGQNQCKGDCLDHYDACNISINHNDCENRRDDFCDGSSNLKRTI